MGIVLKRSAKPGGKRGQTHAAQIHACVLRVFEMISKPGWLNMNAS